MFFATTIFGGARISGVHAFGTREGRAPFYENMRLPSHIVAKNGDWFCIWEVSEDLPFLPALNLGPVLDLF